MKKDKDKEIASLSRQITLPDITKEKQSVIKAFEMDTIRTDRDKTGKQFVRDT